MTLMPNEDALKSEYHWRENLLDLINLFCALIDHALNTRDEPVIQKYLWNEGYEWVGDPNGEETNRAIGRLQNIYLQEAGFEAKVIEGLKDYPDMLANFLAYRDRVMVGVQDLLTNDPKILYLICMHIEYKLEEEAQRRDQDLTNPPTQISALHFYELSRQVRNKLELIYKDLRKSPDEWEEVYKRHL